MCACGMPEDQERKLDGEFCEGVANSQADCSGYGN